MEYPARKISDLFHIAFFLVVIPFMVSAFFTMTDVQKKINRNTGTITSVQDHSDYIPYNNFGVKGADVIASIKSVQAGEPDKIKIIVRHGANEAVYGYESETSDVYLSYRITDSSDPFYIKPLSNYKRTLVFEDTKISCIVFVRQ